MISFINPNIHHYEDTLGTLKFSSRCKPMKSALKYNEGEGNTISSNDADIRIKYLQDERAELKEKLRKIESL